MLQTVRIESSERCTPAFILRSEAMLLPGILSEHSLRALCLRSFRHLHVISELSLATIVMSEWRGGADPATGELKGNLKTGVVGAKCFSVEIFVINTIGSPYKSRQNDSREISVASWIESSSSGRQ